MSKLFARRALLPQGWASNVLLEIDKGGALTAVTPDATPSAPAVDIVIPGMINLHSHAFQRALSGMTERGSDNPDSFWTWRELMYRFANKITPEHMEAIAAQLYAECLRHGYTSVCEFHYIHRDGAGERYADVAETAKRVIAGAHASGIGITMLPVLYSFAGFGEQALKTEQRRFRTDAQDILRIIESLGSVRDAQVEVGVAPHSLRAAATSQIREVLAALPPDRPVHIHIAEQTGEVEQSIAFSGARPVQYLYDQLDVDQSSADQ